MYIPNNKMNDYFSKRCISHKILNFTTGFQVYQIEYMKSLLSPSSPSSELDGSSALSYPVLNCSADQSSWYNVGQPGSLCPYVAFHTF